MIHSATKYINGHGDALGGAVLGSQRFLADVREYGVVHLGACIRPFNAWLIMRGIITLPMRMRQHCENAVKLAQFLESHERVTQVSYPGLPSHPQHELATRQMDGYSGMLTFSLDCELLQNLEFLKHLKVITHAVSLGHDQSLVWFLPTTFFFQDMVQLPEEKQMKYWALMGDGIHRFSVGIEHPDDLIEDLAQALDSFGK